MGRFLSSSLAALAAVSPSAVLAAPVAAPVPVSANATIQHPITVVKLNDLDYGALIVAAAGTATIDPASGTMSLTGGVQQAFGTAKPAALEITANRLAVLVITIPNAPVTLTRSGGTETMTVSNWTLDSFPVRVVPANGVIDFHVGGRLNVNAGQVEGTYSGIFPVTVDYY